VKIRKRLLALIGMVLLGTLLLAACGGEDPTPAPPPPVQESAPTAGEFDPVVNPLPADQAAGLLVLPDASGNTPCGVFDVGGFGERIVELGDYQDCLTSNPSAHTIACLDANAQWSTANVGELTPAGSTITFVSNQEGTCGVFIRPEAQ